MEAFAPTVTIQMKTTSLVQGEVAVDGVKAEVKIMCTGDDEASGTTPLASPATSPLIAATQATPPPPTDEEITKAVDGVLTMAFKMEKELKVNAEDEKAPGELGRIAAARGPRLRRKSKDLQQSFNSIIGPQLEAVFHHFDADGSGTLDQSELKAAFEAAGRPSDDDTISRSVKALDENGDGLISLEEFKSLAWKCALG